MSRANKSHLRIEDNFARVPNEVLADPNLSAMAKTIFAYMVSKKDGWNFTATSIASQMKEGRKAVLSALRNLKEEGYLEYEKSQQGYGDYYLHFPKCPEGTMGDLEEQSESPGGTQIRVPLEDSISKNINNKTKRAKALKDPPEAKKQKKPSPSPPIDKLDFDALLVFINQSFGKEYRVINKTARQSYAARLREGFKKEDIFNAILAVKESAFGREKDYQFATPTYFSKAQSLENWMNRKTKNQTELLLHR